MSASSIEAGRAHVKLWLDSKSAETGIKQFRSTMTGVAASIRSTGQVIDSFARKARNAFLGLAAAAALPVKFASDLATTRAELGRLIKDARKTEDTIRSLQEFAARSPLDFTTLSRSLAALLQVEDLERANQTLREFGDISLGSADKLSGLVTAYTQVANKGRFLAEEMAQLQERGFAPLKELSRSTGRNMTELYDAMSQGQLSVTDLRQAMLAATTGAGTFSGALSELAGTPAARFAALKDSVVQAATALGESLLPIVEKLAGTAKQIIDQTTTWIRNNEGLTTTLANTAIGVAALAGGAKVLGVALGLVSAATGAISPIATAASVAVAKLSTSLAGQSTSTSSAATASVAYTTATTAAAAATATFNTALAASSTLSRQALKDFLALNSDVFPASTQQRATELFDAANAAQHDRPSQQEKALAKSRKNLSAVPGPTARELDDAAKERAALLEKQGIYVRTAEDRLAKNAEKNRKKQAGRERKDLLDSISSRRSTLDKAFQADRVSAVKAIASTARIQRQNAKGAFDKQSPLALITKTAQGAGTSIAATFGEAFATIGTAFSTRLAPILTTLAGVGAAIFNPVSLAIGAIVAGVTALGAVAVAAAAKLGILQAGFASVQRVVSDVLATVRQTVGGIVDAIAAGDWQSAWEIARTGGELAFLQLSQYALQTLGWIARNGVSIMQAMGVEMVKIIVDLASKIPSLIDAYLRGGATAVAATMTAIISGGVSTGLESAIKDAEGRLDELTAKFKQQQEQQQPRASSGSTAAAPTAATAAIQQLRSEITEIHNRTAELTKFEIQTNSLAQALQSATSAEQAEIATLHYQREQAKQNLAIEEQRAKLSQDRQQAVQSEIDSLTAEINQLRYGADNAKLHELALQGASQAELERIAQLRQQRDELTAMKKAEEEAAAAAERRREELKNEADQLRQQLIDNSPLAAFRQSISKIGELLQSGLLSITDAKAAVSYEAQKLASAAPRQNVTVGADLRDGSAQLQFLNDVRAQMDQNQAKIAAERAGLEAIGVAGQGIGAPLQDNKVDDPEQEQVRLLKKLVEGQGKTAIFKL